MDRIDRQILNILQLNGRITNKAIAERIGLSTPAVLERIKKLENNGFIKGYKAILDPEKLGKKITAIMAITIDRKNMESLDKIRDAIISCKEIRSYYFTTGKYDFILNVSMDSITALEEFLMKRISFIIPSIRNVETFIVLSTEEDMGYDISVEE
ncbi:MAG TPA: Lrp/AsnC family transcriptional regulator [Candidatus Mcinerneyibacteriales bacterium]|jgi:Lrp/AsnC family leucine-responsive transcriptional regulator|nr:Lrp/AsnC family transcriptional regulator [Candidatus Mcinerneyibacteriota bacterium]HOO60036.1 Lrp/AsnC family transcriptional regulator [Candidatus Mcinerneyibacteriales bacterium]HPE20324.1 Lrp/AsnC family transcriptional regulator [Candidatus Mcinerneyibacteriales bacterium]HPJ69459.1 Lrp/AsnC family transcriptional regulator [Candidatus Mcinerneyibacteriales bacterium]HPQ90045.1 Lrp/AsnC family transcriptional regulator [Candidatus Mcinerneyibacteriales bacterium]